MLVRGKSSLVNQLEEIFPGKFYVAVFGSVQSTGKWKELPFYFILYWFCTHMCTRTHTHTGAVPRRDVLSGIHIFCWTYPKGMGKDKN